MKGYTIAAIKEKMERDKEEYNITLTVLFLTHPDNLYANIFPAPGWANPPDRL